MNSEVKFQKLLDDLHDSRDWRVRQEAVKLLADFKNQSAMTAIFEALYDESPHVVETATYALKTFGQNAVSGLLEVLYSPQEIVSRRFIIHALDDIDDPDLIPHYIHFLNDSDSGMHYAAALALSTNADERALPHLLEALKRENSAKAQIILALGRIGDPMIIPEIKPMLTSDDYIICRYTAIVLGHSATDEAVTALMDATQEPQSDIRRAAIEGLGIINSDTTFEYLIQLLHTNDTRVRSSVISALGKSQREEAVPLLIAELNRDDHRTIPAIRVALGETGSLSAIPPLLSLFRNDDMHDGRGLSGLCRTYWKYGEVGSSIFPDILQAIRGDDVLLKICAIWLFHDVSFHYADPSENTQVDFQIKHIREFETLFKNDNPDIRLSIMISLSRASLPLLEDAIIHRLQDHDVLIQEMAAKALAYVDTENSIQALAVSTQSKHDRVRYGAINSLSVLNGKRLAGIFQNLLSHSDDWTRRLAVSGLGKIRSRESIPQLIDKFHQEKIQRVRASIIWALGDIGDPQAIPTIIKVLEAEDDGMSFESPFDSALYALHKLNDESALPILNQIIDGGSRWQRRMHAVEAISQIGSEHQIADRLFRLLAHENDTVRTTASKELGYLGARTADLDLRDYIVSNLIKRLGDTGTGYHYSPTVAAMAAKSLYYVGTTEAIAALKNWEETNNDHN